ncbi:LamG domain-containing protein, partial [Patescibacteria group bacterium]|nr:LamG domain-containing protein [Patescibacteria group bacterium]
GVITATGFSSPSVYVNGIGTSSVTSDQWSHIAITTATPFDANAINIGRISTNYFDGTLDEIKIYDYALTADQIKTEYNRSHAVVLGVGQNDSDPGYDNLSAWWKMDDNSSVTAIDSSGNNHDLTLTHNYLSSIEEISPTDISPAITGSWQEEDISSLIPAGAEGICYESYSTSTTEYSWGIRHPDSTDARQEVQEDTSHQFGCIGTDSDRHVDIYIGNSSIHIVLTGYIPDGFGEFKTNAVNKAIGTTNTWTDVNISDDFSQTCAVVFYEVDTSGTTYQFGTRINGNTNDNRPDIYDGDFITGMSGVDQYQIFEQFIESTTTDLYVHGCLYAKNSVHIVTDQNPIEYSIDVGTTYTETTITDAQSDNATGIFFGLYSSDNDGDSSDEYKHAVRKVGDTQNFYDYADVSVDRNGWVACDQNQTIEQRIENAARDLYVWGWTNQISKIPQWTQGKIGTALEFDGVGNYLSIGSTVADLQTISFWINPDSNTESILNLDSTHSVSLSSGSVIATGFSSPSIYVNGIGSSGITANQWNHVAITTATSFDATNIEIGRISTTYFDGTLDNIKIYSKALSIAEVSWEYNQGAPIAHWTFNEGLGTTAYDESDHSFDATLGVGSSAPTWTTGAQPNSSQTPMGKSLDFDGTNDYLSVGSTIPGLQTISFWINPDSTTESVLNLDASHSVSLSSGVITATGFSSPSIYVNGIGTSSITGDQWSHVAITTATPFDANVINIGRVSTNYFDGTLDEIKIFNYALTADQIKTDYNRSSAVVLGVEQNDSDAGYDNLVSWWKMDNSLGNKPITDAYFADELLWYSTLEDIESISNPDTGNTYDINTLSATDIVTAKYGNGLKVTSSGDYFEITDTANFNSINGSIKFWFKPNWNHTDDTSHLLFEINNWTDNDKLSLTKEDSVGSYNLQLNGNQGADDYFNLAVTSGNYQLSNGHWTHFRITWDANASTGETIRLFINGTEPTHSHNDDFKNTFDANPMNISFYGYNKTNHADGTYDEIKIFGGSDDEPTKLAQAGDTSNPNEYLYDNTNNYTLDFVEDDANNRGEYIFLGSNSIFSNISIDLATTGISGATSPDLNWQYWNGTQWTSLESVGGFTDTTSNLTQNGIISWNQNNPSDWQKYSVNGSSDLYYIRSHLESGSYSTYPIENTIKLDQRSGYSTTVNDSSGNNHTGTLGIGSSSPQWTQGKIGTALEFDGTNDYLSVGSTVPGLQTISFWINPNSTTESILNLDSTHSVSLSSGSVIATGFSSPSVYVNGIGSSAITANQWNHVAITTATSFNADAIEIGRISTTYFDGTLDNIKIYSKALSTAEVSWEYNQGAPIAHWTFNEGLGTTAYDESDHNNDGTLTNMDPATDWVSGKFNGALDFDGDNDYINAGSDDSLDNLNEFTYTVWLYPRGRGENNEARIFDKRSSNPGFETQITTDYEFFAIRNCNTTNAMARTPDNTLKINQWQHLVVTYTNNDINIFVNGILQQNDQNSDCEGGLADDSSETLFIGNYSTPIRTFDGLIDEVKIYNYALTADQVKTDYNNGAVRFSQ